MLNGLALAPALVSSTFLPQESEFTFRWIYAWLAAGGLLLTFALLTFGYLMVRRRWDDVTRLLRHPVLIQATRWLERHVPRFWGFIRQRFSARHWHGLAFTLAAAVFAAAIYLFAVITESWTDEDALYAIDRHVYDWLVESMTEPVVAFMRVVTHLGDGLAVAVFGVVLGIGLLLRRRYWEVVSLFLAVGVGYAVMWGLKLLFARGRPGERLADVLGHSFPSGHSFAAMTLYGFLIYLTWRYLRHDALRIGATLLLVLLILQVGLSRIILRVHWVSDVAGGFTVGLAWLVCSLILARALRAFLSDDASGSDASTDLPEPARVGAGAATDAP